jgi:rRNA maturation endonuclease Nob1
MSMDRPLEQNERMSDDEYRRLAEFRRHTVVNRVAEKTSPAEDMLTLSESTIWKSVDQLLDALATLAISAEATKAKRLRAVRSQNAETALPSFNASWADTVLHQVDNRLWELTEEINAFLNRPDDPKNWGDVCDTCGRKRTGEAIYCQHCGSRILAGARRCRLTGCPNEGHRRANCPKDIPH